MALSRIKKQQNVMLQNDIQHTDINQNDTQMNDMEHNDQSALSTIKTAECHASK